MLIKERQKTKVLQQLKSACAMHILLSPFLPPSIPLPREDSTNAPKPLNRTCKPNFLHHPKAFLWLTYNSNKSVMLFALAYRRRVLLMIIVTVLRVDILSILYYHLMIFLLSEKPWVIVFGFGCCCFYLQNIEAVAKQDIINLYSDVINR